MIKRPEKAELEEIFRMLKSPDKETRLLGNALFWKSDYINQYKGYKPYMYVIYRDSWNQRQILTFMQFRRRSAGSLILCEQILKGTVRFTKVIY